MTKKKNTKNRAGQSLLTGILSIFYIVYCSTILALNTEFVLMTSEDSYKYSVVQTGDNYNFKFEKNLEGDAERLEAGYHVFQSVFNDASINKTHSESYIRERARCYVFDSNLNTYTLCFLPNEFSQEQHRLRGFVTQIPNWKWQFTRILLPALVVFALFFFFGTLKEYALKYKNR